MKKERSRRRKIETAAAKYNGLPNARSGGHINGIQLSPKSERATVESVFTFTGMTSPVAIAVIVQIQ